MVRGAEVGSDHYLALIKIQMRIVERRECMGNVGKGRIRVWKLKNAKVRIVYQNAMVRKSREVKHVIQRVQWKRRGRGVEGNEGMHAGFSE